MPISQILKTKRDGTIAIRDNALANSVTVAFEAGDFALNIPGPTIISTLDRGRFTDPPSLRYGDDQAMTGTFTAYLRDVSDATYATLEEVLTNSGIVASTWVSVMGANGEVKAYDILWTIAGTTHGDAANHTIRLKYCVITGSLQEGDPSTISASFTDYELYPTVT